VRLYENVIDEEKGVLDEDGNLNLNPHSLVIHQDSRLELALADAKPYDRFQFVRHGYFCVDSKLSTAEALVFNRIVSLKSSFTLPSSV
jgi:glutaminyl-tRNA synthetase